MAKQPSPTRARHRSFSFRGKSDDTPVTFDIDGTEFTCHAQVPGTVLLEHVERLSDGKTAAAELLAIWTDVFDHTRATKTDDDGNEVEVEGTSEYERFRAVVDDPNYEVDVQALGELLAWVLGELAGSRPTDERSPSQRGRSTTGATSPSDSNGSAAKATSTP